MNPKLLQTAARIAIFVTSSLVIGTTIKLERSANEKIKQHFNPAEEVPENL